MKLGYGIKGISGTNFEVVSGEADAVKFLRELDTAIAYAFVIDENGEAKDLVATDATWEE